eukprot:scaffold1966_cov118-Isochrysis_galbana.AAC.1
MFRRPLLLVAPTPDGGLIHVPLVSPRTGGRWERPHSDRGGAACVACCLLSVHVCLPRARGRVEAEPHASNAGAWLARMSSACFHESARIRRPRTSIST